MAHEFESGMFVGDAAWHKLGNVITEAPSIKDGIILAGLDWKVNMENLYLGDGRLTKQRAIVRQSDQSILGYSGSQWQPLQNTEAFDFFQPMVNSGLVDLETAGSLRNGQIIWVLAKIKNAQSEVIKNDPIQRYFLLSNSHNAGRAVQIGYCDIRVVCANTMALAESSEKSKLIRLVHGKNLQTNLGDLQDMVNLSKQSFEADLKKLEVLAKKGINRKDLEKFVDVIWYPNVIELTARQKTHRTNTIYMLDDLMESGIGTDITNVKGTAYGLYNAATEFWTHYDGKTQDDRLSKLWVGGNQSKNEKALDYLLKAA
jgi:phage/plasmid-like protein (TIGR03299 family)